MEVMFVEAIRKNLEIPGNLPKLLSKLPKNIHIAYTIQYKDYASRIKEKISEKFNITGFTQVIGCSQLNTSADAILLIGSGRFHAIELALSSGKEVYMLENKMLGKITASEIAGLKNKRKALLSKFYASEKIGILVSLKPGQFNLAKAMEFYKTLKSKGKKPYLLMGDSINPRELENFQIESWVNTACPGLELDASLLNIRDIPENEC